ncbi:MAG: nucleoside deaminase [Lewinellaceae bacterium]|nr:nucleoside deaminase [Lewinella sp.]MCB9279394.1 nucleoside deaminase [Lewinellaceae bacterium]
MISKEDQKFLQLAIELAQTGIDRNAGGPFGAVIVRDGQIIGSGYNRVTSSNDPTAHAEVEAIREACRLIGSFQLDGCTIYASCEPCPMCLGAIYWARPGRVVYACTREDAAAIGFDDDFIYRELETPVSERQIPVFQAMRAEGMRVFEAWKNKRDKMEY